MQEEKVVINVMGDKNILNFYGKAPEINFNDDVEKDKDQYQGIAPTSTQGPGR